MKLCRFNDNRLGLVQGTEVIDVTEALNVLPSSDYLRPRHDALIANLGAVCLEAQKLPPAENKWIGQRISNPAPDLAMMARGQGMEGVGPIEAGAELGKALEEAIKVVRDGKAIVLDVMVSTGYIPAMTAGLTRSSD